MKQTILIDTAYERYAGLRIKHEYTGKLAGGYQLFFAIGFVALYFGGVRVLDYVKNKQETQYRTGQVSYRDREFKFF